MTQNDILNSIREQLEDGRLKAMAEGRKQGMEEGLEEGLEQGLEQGLLQGRAAARNELVKKMLEARIAVEQVAQIADMSVEDVLRLR